jgi:hypothetical protein
MQTALLAFVAIDYLLFQKYQNRIQTVTTDTENPTSASNLLDLSTVEYNFICGKTRVQNQPNGALAKGYTLRQVECRNTQPHSHKY